MEGEHLVSYLGRGEIAAAAILGAGAIYKLWRVIQRDTHSARSDQREDRFQDHIMARNRDLEERVDRLRAERDKLTDENARLSADLAVLRHGRKGPRQ